MRASQACGDGSLTVLELTRLVAERCQRMLPSVVVRVDKLTDGEGCILFPEDRVYEVLDNNGKVIASIEGTTGEVAGVAGGKRRKQSPGAGTT